MDTPLTAKSPDMSVASSDIQQSFSNNASRLSQTHCLNTTVPINIVGSDIGGRHAPTRSALRHSRMIAKSHTGKKAGTGHLSIIVRYPTLAKYFVCLQNKTALIILALSTWMLIQIPNLNYRDVPLWSGALLLLSGLVNGGFLWCCRKKVSENSPSWYSFYPKFSALSVTILAALTCLCALVFASVHVYVIRVAECLPLDNQNSSCVCRVHTANEYDSIDIIDIGSQTYQYPSLSCQEVTSLLVIALIGSAVANAVGAVVSLYYVFLHKTSTFSHKYAQVPATDSSPVNL